MLFDGFDRVTFILLALCHLPDYGFIQTPCIRAPEVMLGLLSSRAMDMWSFGCCLIELLSGHQPFTALNELEQLTNTIEVILKATGCSVGLLLIYLVIDFSQYTLVIYLIIIDIRLEAKTGYYSVSKTCAMKDDNC